jgi:hypothetical protein
MQIIQLHIKGYKSVIGSPSSFATNKLIDSTANFNETVEVGDLVTNVLPTIQGLRAFVTAIDSDTQLSLSEDIFTGSFGVETYKIESDYIKADMFEDESVSITESLVNVRDISKVFTPFSQQFNLPASKLNNKLFRHYENLTIENSFDARFRHDAIIKLNGIDYRKGQIQFKSVTLKDNKAHAYKVVFYGETVELKEVLGDRELSSLDYGDLNFDYTSAQIRNRLTADATSLESLYGSNATDVLVPNIQHSKNMRYTTTGGYQEFGTTNGLSYVDLKPAIRIRSIVQAINRTQSNFNITGFLDSQQIDDIYMWMHRNEGFITNSTDGGGTQIIRNRFHSTAETDYTFNSNPSGASVGDVRTVFVTGTRWLQEYEITACIYTSTSVPYTIRILRTSDEEPLLDVTHEAGTSQCFTVDVDSRHFAIGSPIDIIVEVQTENALTITSQTLQIEKKEREDFFSVLPQTTTWVALYDAVSFNTDNTFYISKQIPKMKVIDFLSGLFKMFNLVVYRDGYNIITQTSTSFMNSGLSYDITKYVDSSTASLERLFQYKEMSFKFKSKKSFLVQYADEINQDEFGNELYNPDAKWDGGTYKVEVPFEKMMFERLTDENGAFTLIGQGAFINREYNPTIGEPLLFCMERQANTDSEFTIDSTTPAFYRRPTQLTTTNWDGVNKLSLNFSEEKDEFLLEVPSGSINLFDNGYDDYIEAVFDRKARMLKVSAYLPLSILQKLKLNDRLVIANTVFVINKIKTNLLTNKSDLELYNKEEFISQIENSQFAYLGRLASLTETTKGSDFITVTWDAVTGATGYNVYVNGGLHTAAPNTTTTLKVSGLEKDSWYFISVRVKYDINGTDAFSFDTTILSKTLGDPVALAENGDTLITEGSDTIILE